MMIQLDPMIPVYVPRFNIEGYAFIATRYSQEHYVLFTVALDNGEIWDVSNREVRFCVNHTMDRHKINSSGGTEYKQTFNGKSDTTDTSLVP